MLMFAGGAALWEKRPLPRAGMWFAAAACIAVGSFIVWIYDLVGRSEFTGHVNWDEGRLYSADASKLAHERCPRCGGEIALAGKGTAQCAHCGSEIFLG
jgi:ribosomal protein S27AE